MFGKRSSSQHYSARPQQLLDEKLVTPEGLANSVGCFLFRNFGAEESSRLADLIVASVQRHARQACDCQNYDSDAVKPTSEGR